jgi:hypothetical protein
VLEDPWPIVATAITVVNLTAVTVSCIVLCVSTVAQVVQHPVAYWTLFALETVSMTWFVFDFLLRILTVRDRLKFCMRPLNVVDFLTILPYFAELATGVEVSALTAIRVIRLTRVMRLSRLSRTSGGLRDAANALINSGPALSLLVFMLMISTMIFGTAAYFAEQFGGAEFDTVDRLWIRADGVISPFQSIFHSMWWCIVTMSTVGYGDNYPITPVGKFIGFLTMFSGVLVIAFPTVILSATFHEAYYTRMTYMTMQKVSHMNDRLLRANMTKKAAAKDDDDREQTARDGLPDGMKSPLEQEMAAAGFTSGKWKSKHTIVRGGDPAKRASSDVMQKEVIFFENHADYMRAVDACNLSVSRVPLECEFANPEEFDRAVKKARESRAKKNQPVVAPRQSPAHPNIVPLPPDVADDIEPYHSFRGNKFNSMRSLKRNGSSGLGGSGHGGSDEYGKHPRPPQVQASASPVSRYALEAAATVTSERFGAAQKAEESHASLSATVPHVPQQQSTEGHTGTQDGTPADVLQQRLRRIAADSHITNRGAQNEDIIVNGVLFYSPILQLQCVAMTNIIKARVTRTYPAGCTITMHLLLDSEVIRSIYEAQYVPARLRKAGRRGAGFIDGKKVTIREVDMGATSEARRNSVMNGAEDAIGDVDDQARVLKMSRRMQRAALKVGRVHAVAVKRLRSLRVTLSHQVPDAAEGEKVSECYLAVDTFEQPVTSSVPLIIVAPTKAAFKALVENFEFLTFKMDIDYACKHEAVVGFGDMQVHSVVRREQAVVETGSAFRTMGSFSSPATRGKRRFPSPFARNTALSGQSHESAPTAGWINNPPRFSMSAEDAPFVIVSRAGDAPAEDNQ